MDFVAYASFPAISSLGLVIALRRDFRYTLACKLRKGANAIEKQNIEIVDPLMLIDTGRTAFDMRQIGNRRFMFSPQSGELILGRQYKGGQFYASHAEEHGESGAKAPYDSFIQGWIGTGRQYPHGVIHFAPHVESTNVERFEKAFSALEMFRENGAEAQTVIRGFGDAWEQPLSNIIPDQERSGQQWNPKRTSAPRSPSPSTQKSGRSRRSPDNL